MSNTNDEQAPYGEKREPLLSDAMIRLLWKDAVDDGGRLTLKIGLFAKNVRDFYENLIDKGELRVVKEVTAIRMGAHSFCSDCGTCIDPHTDFANRPPNPLCPGCGGEIQK